MQWKIFQKKKKITAQNLKIGKKKLIILHVKFSSYFKIYLFIITFIIILL